MIKKSKGKVILSHYSALVMIRYARILGAKLIKCEDEEILHNARCPNVDEVKLLSQFVNKQTGKSYKLDVLLDRVNKKARNSLINCHSCKYRLSAENFYNIVSDDEVLNTTLFNSIVIVSPELAIFQLSRIVPVWRLLQWTIELMGNYAIDINCQFGFTKCKPLITNLKNMKNLTISLSNSKLSNNSNLILCIDYAASGSVSPAETNLYILLCGPRKLGFFQIRKLIFNIEIELSDEAIKISGQNSVTPDLLYLNKKVAIEYDSDAFHTNNYQDQKDKRRIMALTHDGWKVFVVTAFQINNYNSFCQLALDILKACGQDKRIRSKKFHKYSRENFYALLRH
ncbi:MAG: hypothetical protein Q4E88_03615 [Coriobacteriia bacterium]|nr:hypothetical protein [Coriobacteriia bacterium]